MALATRTDVAVVRLDVAAYTVPTDEPESDGTLEWDSTTIVVVEAHAGGETGLGYTYAATAAGTLVEEKLRDVVVGADALAPQAAALAMGRALRNVGRPGLAFCALSAHVFCGVPTLRHLEYFHDHVRIERLLFDGVLEPEGGALRPDTSRPGLGIELKREEAERWAA